MRQPALRPLDEERGIDRDAALGLGVEFHHPATHAVRIKLFVPGAVKRVGEVNAAAIAAHFHHLWAAVERTLCGRVFGLLHNAADLDRARVVDPEPRAGVGQPPQRFGGLGARVVARLPCGSEARWGVPGAH